MTDLLEEKTENLTDHSYDGIQEYDNPTPGWWVAIFVFTIIFSCVYGVFFHFSPESSNVKQSYQDAVAANARKKYAKWGELKLDQASLLTYMRDNEKLAVGQAIFRMNCASCHGPEGGGATGPNMTDDFYKNVATLEDIPKVIRDGAAKGTMPSWRVGPPPLSDNDIACVAAFIATLRGKNLPGNAPYGDKIAPWPQPATSNPASQP